MAPLSKSTWKQYNMVYTRFKTFCSKTNNNQDNPSVECILEFLSELYNNGSGYVSINLARSALSTLFGKIDGVMLGSHPLVKRLVRGVYKLRPPQCKYEMTWDTSVVLDYLSKLNNVDMDLR
jgi:hypothetical protein